jgi:uncharacterized membrane protein YhiD involved in acid resistance
MFTSVLETGDVTIINALICTGASLVLGLIISLVYMCHGPYSKNFVITLVLLPALVQVVILMVSGNLGAGVAVLGTFSLVRFRSVPGSAKEIGTIFFAMAIGLATGMGYVTFAFTMTVVIGLVFFLLFRTRYGERAIPEKELRVTIPESLDYTGIFDEVFEQYTRKASLQRVKTTNLGSLYELSYHIVLKESDREKEFIDAIRCRNGNLTVICGRRQTASDEL